MRILHLDLGGVWRGGQQQAYYLHRHLLHLGEDSVLLAPEGSPLLLRCRKEGLRAHSFRGGVARHPCALLAVREAAGGQKVLLHAHDAKAVFAGALAKLCGIAGILVAHRRVAYPLAPSRLARWKNGAADGWVAVSQEVAAMLARGIPPGRTVAVVHSALDLAAFRDEALEADLAALRRELSLPGDAPVVGLLGAFSHQKGHATLLEAAPAILSRFPTAIFLLAGEGPLRAGIAAKAKLMGISDNFRFPGFRADGAALTSLMTVAVVPSIDGEGSSASIKEPMALGVPVVVSELAGNIEVGGDAVKTFPVGDAAALAAALTLFLEDAGEREKSACRGVERSPRFSVEAMGGGVLDLYKRVGFR